MDKVELEKTLKDTFGSVILDVQDPDGILTVTITSDSVIPVVKFLKDNLSFSFLTDLCGIHFPEKELALGIVYHMHNMKENTRIRLKTYVPVGNPSLASLTSLFPAANWMERETFDFYGILFEGHPNLKRILNVEYLDYFPMRKEYPLEDPTRHDKDDRFFGR
jgi:NADH-quinone oxidoreductase subunit C